jgi:CRISPR-associated protein Cas2
MRAVSNGRIMLVMNTRYPFLIGYDIVCDKRRRQIHEAVMTHALGGQKSLYECFWTSSEMQQVRHQVWDIMDSIEDRVFIVQLEPRLKTFTLGCGRIATEPDYFLIG